MEDLEPTVAYRESRQVEMAEADGLFLSDTNRRTIDVIEAGIPVKFISMEEAALY